MKVRTGVLLAMAALAAVFVLVVTNPAGAAPVAPEAAPGHTWGQVDDVCQFIEHGTFGNEPNGISRQSRPDHYWGQHQANCCFFNGAGNYSQYMYDFRGHGSWVSPRQYWCGYT